MSTEITLTLSDITFRRAQRLASLVERPVGDLLSETIELSLAPMDEQPDRDAALAALPDDEVLAMADLRLPADQDARLSRLLDDQQAGRLAEADRLELFALMQGYQDGLLRKARGLREAVRRGLRPALSP